VQFQTVLFDLIPRKVMVSPDEARDMIREVRAFLAYLGREFELENVSDCLALVRGDAAIARLREALAEPRNWGMAKSLMMEGKDRGFDVSSKEGIEEWMAAHNAGLSSPPRRTGATAIGHRPRPAAGRGKRKLQKAARRKNR
jgi:hypothetical protein